MEITANALQEYFKNHQTELKSILKLIHKAAKVRLNTIKTKENICEFVFQMHMKQHNI